MLRRETLDQLDKVLLRMKGTSRVMAASLAAIGKRLVYSLVNGTRDFSVACSCLLIGRVPVQVDRDTSGAVRVRDNRPQSQPVHADCRRSHRTGQLQVCLNNTRHGTTHPSIGRLKLPLCRLQAGQAPQAPRSASGG